MKLKIYLASTAVCLILAMNVRADTYSTCQKKGFYSANGHYFVEVKEKKRATLYRNSRRVQRAWSPILPELPRELLVTNNGNRVVMIDFYYGNSHAPDAPQTASPFPKVQLSEINLARVGRLSSKGRVQDEDYNQLPIVQQLIAHGKDSIPFLISKLEDETKIDGHVIAYWNQVYVGDVALIILSDFFLDRNWESSTIEGMKWDEFLERGGNKEVTGEQLLRNYIERHGRKKIKERWLQAWEKYQERIYWDKRERNFTIRKL